MFTNLHGTILIFIHNKLAIRENKMLVPTIDGLDRNQSSFKFRFRERGYFSSSPKYLNPAQFLITYEYWVTFAVVYPLT